MGSPSEVSIVGISCASVAAHYLFVCKDALDHECLTNLVKKYEKEFWLAVWSINRLKIHLQIFNNISIVLWIVLLL